jgi:D-amino-acid dehydrogenase
MRVIVIGGGAVGLAVAESLISRGVEVTVFERDRCGSGASAGNAGWITPSISLPVPAPGVIGESLRWLVNPQGPLWIRPTLSPAMLGWIARFIAGCRRNVYQRGFAALQQAAALAQSAFDRLADRGVRFEMHVQPLLYPAFAQRELAQLERVAAELNGGPGVRGVERLSASELRALEPGLDERVLGGLLARGESRVRPESLVAGLRDAVLARGAEVLEHAEVSSIQSDGTRWVVRGPSAERRADRVVLANGVGSTRLVESLGVRLPVAAAKGYSRTYAIDPTGPKRPLYLEGPRVSISVFDEGVRISGTLELGAVDLSLSQRRLSAITAAAQQALPGWKMPTRPSDWAGMRSLTPDGLPYIGRVPGAQGVHVVTGHATLGITLAPLSAELVAGSLLDSSRHPLLDAFDPARAARRVHNQRKATTGENAR